MPDPGGRRRRGQIVALIVVLVLAMAYSLALLWLKVTPELTIAILGAVAAVTVRLCRSLSATARAVPEATPRAGR